MVIGLIFLLPALILGRFFCGWICPLGTLIDATDKTLKSKNRKSFGISRNIKYFILGIILVSMLFALQWVWFFDPIALLTRTVVTGFYPVFVHLTFALFDGLFSLNILDDAVYAAFNWGQQTILPIDQPTFLYSVPVLLIFSLILAASLLSRRFWCRYLCPLGALYSLFSRHRILKRRVSDACTSCGICVQQCRMDAISEDFTATRTAECIECGECVEVCPTNAISYGFSGAAKQIPIDASKRRTLVAAGFGVFLVAITKTGRTAESEPPIRPPGAISEDKFLDTCIRCQQCLQICSSTGAGLQPALWEAGLEGLWSPILIPRMGYCEFNCNLCGQVCPSGAIQKLNLADKQALKIGRAYINKNTCIPWNDNINCLVCEEHCPLEEKAIKFEFVEIKTEQGEKKIVKRPYVDDSLCIGCGICETKCPVSGKPGIFLTSQNNQRIEVLANHGTV